MKRFLLFGFLLISFSAFANSDAELAKGKVIKELSFPEKEPFGTVDVRAVIEASPKVVWNLLVHLERWTEWMPSLSEGWFYSEAAIKNLPNPFSKDRHLSLKLKEQHPGHQRPVDPEFVGEAERMAYENYDLPWPIHNEWVVRKYFYDAKRAAEQTFKASWAQVFHDNKKNEGFWLLEPFQGDAKRTLLTYHYWVRPKEGLTRILFKWGVKMFVGSMIDRIRDEAGKVQKEMSAL